MAGKLPLDSDATSGHSTSHAGENSPRSYSETSRHDGGGHALWSLRGGTVDCQSADAEKEMKTQPALAAGQGPNSGRSLCASDISEHDRERFWNMIESDPIRTRWNWKGGRDAGGYGRIKIGVNYVSAHRISFALAGNVVPAGMCICHHCDNRKCVNPDHLWLGTHKENGDDMTRKGRHRASSGLANGAYTKPEARCRGKTHGMSKLTDEMVRIIRSEYVFRKTPLRVFAERFSVTTPSVWFALKKEGGTWKHVT